MAESTRWECRKWDYNRNNYPKEAKVLVKVECLLMMTGVYPGISQATEAGNSVWLDKKVYRLVTVNLIQTGINLGKP